MANETPSLTGFARSATFAEKMVNAAPPFLGADVAFFDAGDLIFKMLDVCDPPATFPSSIDLTTLGGDGFKIQGDADGDAAGLRVSSAGDFNGDGFADIIVAAPFSDGGGTFSGAAYMIFGHAGGFGAIDLGSLTASDGFKILGAPGDHAGNGISAAGDVNGDGFDDIIIGTYGNDAGGTNAGAAYVIFGHASGFGTVDLGAPLTADQGFKIQGDADQDCAGLAVSAAGDVNGDDIPDIIVAAPFNDSGGNDAGAAYVIYGGASGFGTIDLGALTAGQGFKIQGEDIKDYAGSSISAAGDVNGDGFDDIVVGAYCNDGGGDNEGAAYVIFGHAGGPGTIDLGALTASQGFKIQGDVDEALVGWSVSGAGDVNGDGIADFVIAALADNEGGENAGAAYVIFGHAAGVGEFGAIDLGALTASQGFKILGGTTSDSAGRSVSGAGDVNGDGFADIIVGAPNNSSGGTFAGAAYVIFGHAGGFGTIDLGALTAGQGFKVQGDADHDYAGMSVSGAGDVNGDGFDDLIVGAPFNDSGDNNAGAAYVIFGHAATANTAPTLGANLGLTVDEGASATINSTMLDYNDAEQADSAIIYTITSAATNGTLRLNGSALGLNGTFTQADIDSGLVTYAHDGSETTSAAFGFTVSDGDGGSVPGQSFIFTVNPIDDPAVAVSDAAETDENATVNILVLANDSDPDGPPPGLALVDDIPIAVGAPVTLVSGAIVSLNDDGTLTYDPNGRFNTLTSTASGEIGAVNIFALDSFTYSLAGTGGGTAAVSVMVNGVASAEDRLAGDTGHNNITGTPGGDSFDLSQGGNDIVSGLEGNDGFFFGAAFTAADHVDGGAGTNDQIGLRGDYAGSHALVLGANTIANVEAIVVLPGFSYDITTVDANVAAGVLLSVQATRLAIGQNLHFDGSAETDGKFMIYGGQGDDDLTGGAGNDGFYFGPGGFNGSDIVNGGAGTNDQLGLDGDYTITLGGNLTGIEAVVLLHGPAATPNNFDLTAADSLVGAGETMTIFGLQVETGIRFDGSPELDGTFKIYGGTGDDVLIGSHGNDWIFGGNGTDTLTGGGGNDVFYYDSISQATPLSADEIEDFNAGDRIDLSGIDAITGGANDAFTFIGTSPFTNHAGELQIENVKSAIWAVSGDTDGDGQADFQLFFVATDAHPITSADFTL